MFTSIRFGSEESLWAETFAIYMNYQYLAEYIEENSCGSTRLEYKN